MPWTDPFSAIPGQLMTAALWNVQVRDNLNILKTSVANDGRLNGEFITHRGAVVALAIVAGVVAVDLAAANAFALTLVAPVTAINVTGWAAAKEKTITIRITQDATGGRTVAFPAAWKTSYSVPLFMPAAANQNLIVVLYSDDGGITVFAAVFVTAV
jgi:hypothetical protein